MWQLCFDIYQKNLNFFQHLKRKLFEKAIVIILYSSFLCNETLFHLSKKIIYIYWKMYYVYLFLNIYKLKRLLWIFGYHMVLSRWVSLTNRWKSCHYYYAGQINPNDFLPMLWMHLRSHENHTKTGQTEAMSVTAITHSSNHMWFTISKMLASNGIN